jgi:SAM-dependent methyltransferase
MTMTPPATLTPTLAVLDVAEIEAGDRVLDVACGDGDTTLEAARRVGPRGLALGVDESALLVERARRRACEAGLANVGFLRATREHTGSRRCASTRSSASAGSCGGPVMQASPISRAHFGPRAGSSSSVSTIPAAWARS